MSLNFQGERSNCLCLSYLSDAHLSSKKIDSTTKDKDYFQLESKYFLGAEISVAEIRQASKIPPVNLLSLSSKLHHFKALLKLLT